MRISPIEMELTRVKIVEKFAATFKKKNKQTRLQSAQTRILEAI